MKRFVKLSDVKKSLRNGSRLGKETMEEVNAGTNDIGPVLVSKICPYLNDPYCPYLYTDYAAPCPWNYQCQNVSLYSSPTCTGTIADNGSDSTL